MKYLLLDSRAGFLAAMNESSKGVLETDDNSKFVLFKGSLRQCCKHANKKISSGLLKCVISTDSYRILWGLYDCDKEQWNPNLIDIYASRRNTTCSL